MKISLIVILCISLTSQSSVPLVLLISFDGFRWDYPNIYNLGNFHRLKSRGVTIPFIKNTFTTLTFPSHFSIITGLYEETHGMIANTMFDPQLNATGTFDTFNDTQWWSQNSYTQPIWISNQLANDSIHRRSGVIAWPGCNVPINGHSPARYQAFNDSRTFNSVLKQIFDWFLEPIETRINFGVIYHHEPDVTGHKYGPFSNEMNQTLHECDRYIAQILQIIDENEYLKENLHVIITSDHGMAEIEKNHQIILEDYIDTRLFFAYGSRAIINIFVHSQTDIDLIYKNLSQIENYEVYKKSQIPIEYHYQSNIRIGDILFLGKLGYEIILPDDNASIQLHGDHGYDNRKSAMHPIFYAFGPKFRRNFEGKPFRNIDIYPLISHILDLNQRKTNGSFDRVKHLLQEDNRSLNYFFYVILFLFIYFLSTQIYKYFFNSNEKRLTIPVN